MKKITDIICICLVAILFAGVVVLNATQANRPTVSELEKRELASMPELTGESLADGSFFSGVSTFISDTFIGRDKLVALSKQMDTLKGIDYSIGGKDDTFVVINPGGQDTGIPVDSGISDKINEALNNLESGNNDTDTNPPETQEPQDTEDTSDTRETDRIPFDTDPVDSEDTNDTNDTNDTDDTGSGTEPEYEDIPVGMTQLDNGTIEQVTDRIIKGDHVTMLTVSRGDISLTPGSGSSVTAVPTTALGGGAELVWSVSDPKVATIAPAQDGSVNIKAAGAGTCTVSCRTKDGSFTSNCNITVAEITDSGTQQGVEADFLPSGLFIYGDAVYTPAYYNEYASQTYAQAALYYKTLFGSGVRVSLVVSPVSAMVIDNPAITSQISNQKDILDAMAALCDPSINFVDTYTEMYAHRSEYLFFKSDHHWTARGAYYAYAAYSRSIGIEPTPISSFGYEVVNDAYQGTMYSYTYDARVANFYDQVEVYIPTKAHTMTVTDINGYVYDYDSSIVIGHHSYLSFISGDHPYTVINVPENPQDRNVLVLKDSFGNAFVPYLCEIFGNIYVVDVRHSSMNVYEQFKDMGITDIIFMNNIQAANNTAWSSMYMAAVGIY